MISNDVQQAAEEATYERLRDASSLGTPAARRFRERTGPDTTAQTWVDAHTSEPAKLRVLRPRSYNDARTIGDEFHQSQALIVNLVDVDDTDAKRLVDFMAGLTFALHGRTERIGGRVFLLTSHADALGESQADRADSPARS